MITLTTEQKVKVTVVPLTANGNPARLDGVPGWSVSNPSVASLDIDPTGMFGYVFASGPGMTVLSVAGDADLTSGVRQIVGTLDITVTESEAVSLSLEAGAVESV